MDAIYYNLDHSFMGLPVLRTGYQSTIGVITPSCNIHWYTTPRTELYLKKPGWGETRDIIYSTNFSHANWALTGIEFISTKSQTPKPLSRHVIKYDVGLTAFKGRVSTMGSLLDFLTLIHHIKMRFLILLFVILRYFFLF